MKTTGFLLMTAGWLAVLGAVIMVPASPLRAACTLAGLAVEAVGLVLAVRAHSTAQQEQG
jgi:hypothetical protein